MHHEAAIDSMYPLNKFAAVLANACIYLSISGRVNIASATETVDSNSIPDQVKLKTIKKLEFTASLLDVLQ